MGYILVVSRRYCADGDGGVGGDNNGMVVERIDCHRSLLTPNSVAIFFQVFRMGSLLLCVIFSL